MPESPRLRRTELRQVVNGAIVRYQVVELDDSAHNQLGPVVIGRWSKAGETPVFTVTVWVPRLSNVDMDPFEDAVFNSYRFIEEAMRMEEEEFTEPNDMDPEEGEEDEEALPADEVADPRSPGQKAEDDRDAAAHEHAAHMSARAEALEQLAGTQQAGIDAVRALLLAGMRTANVRRASSMSSRDTAYWEGRYDMGWALFTQLVEGGLIPPATRGEV